jgi:hypothetical protein
MRALVVSGQQQKQFEKHLAQFFYTTLTPLSRLESPELKVALATLGATAPSRRQASGPLLDEAYSQAVETVVTAIQQWPQICVTMDGWKKKTCEYGDQLITVIVLLPDGTSHFWKVWLLLNLYYIVYCQVLQLRGSVDVSSSWLCRLSTQQAIRRHQRT